MAKTPKHEDTDTGAAEQQAPQPNELAVTLAAVERENVALADESEAIIAQLKALEAEVAELRAEREQQHGIVMDLHAQLTRLRAPLPTEKIITAPKVRNYGE